MPALRAAAAAATAASSTFAERLWLARLFNHATSQLRWPGRIGSLGHLGDSGERLLSSSGQSGRFGSPRSGFGINRNGFGVSQDGRKPSRGNGEAPRRVVERPQQPTQKRPVGDCSDRDFARLKFGN